MIEKGYTQGGCVKKGVFSSAFDDVRDAGFAKDKKQEGETP